MQVEELQTPGERIRWLRMAKDLKQSTLGQLANVSQGTISQLERDLWVPRPIIRRQIAEVLCVHESFIWHNDDLARMRERVTA